MNEELSGIVGLRPDLRSRSRGAGRDQPALFTNWYAATSFVVHLNLTDDQPHDIELYAVDWDNQFRHETIQVTNATTGAVLDSVLLTNFAQGVYLQFMVTGSVVIKVTSDSDASAVLSGIFFDPASSMQDPPPTTATLVQADTTTQGNWIGTYGTLGYDIPGETPSMPSYATVGLSGEQEDTAAITPNDPVALQNVDGVGRDSTFWFSGNKLSVDVTIASGYAVQVGLYEVDWGGDSWLDQVQVTDGATGAVLDTQVLSNFTQGTYLDWTVTGSVVITITRLTTAGPGLSGIFLDPAAPAATAVKTDSTTQGNWIGTYGTQGYDVIGGTSSVPGYATVQPTGQSTITWAGITGDPRSLKVPDGGRVAAAWASSTSFTVNVDFTDGQAHDLALYAVDWLSQGISEQIQLTDAATGAVLATDTLSNFSGGDFLQWRVYGDILITVTRLAGPSAVISGLFFDPASISTSAADPTTAAIVKQDSTTEGNWDGAYGSQGYDLANGSSDDVPHSMFVEFYGASTVTWAASTTDPRALQQSSGSGAHGGGMGEHERDGLERGFRG